jgi:ABC-type uncharacterized transport system auxiliary subunit
MRKLLFPIVLLLLFLYGCGTTQSLKESNYVPYAVVTVTSDLTVHGRLINTSDSTVSISVDGAIATYNLDEIIRYKRYMWPDQIQMQQDIVNNTNAAAGNSAFFVALTVISIVATAVLVGIPE